MIIVTGATGFIGSNIVADLNAAGRSDIILVDDLGTESKWKNIAKRRFQDVVLPAELDGLLSKLPGGDMVYHMGANSSTTSFDADKMLLSNFRTSKSLWEWCSATQTPLIYASSAATYGDGALGFADDQSLAALDALRPLNLYESIRLVEACFRQVGGCAGGQPAPMVRAQVFQCVRAK